MQKLDDMYIVIKKNDALLALTGEERFGLQLYLDKIEDYRVSKFRPVRKYVVISDIMECYKPAYNMVLGELNESK